MSNLTYIYKNENGKIKLLDTLNYTIEEFKNNLIGCYPNWDKETMIASSEKYEHPILDAQGLREMTKYEQFKNDLYELQENELEFEGDIKTLIPGEYLENGEIKKKEKPEGVKIEWNWTTHEWEEKATDLEIVEAQYNEYAGMDTPSVLKEMEMQEPTLATELINMLIELRGIMYMLQSEVATFGTELMLPKPSEKLLNFKNRFNKI